MQVKLVVLEGAQKGQTIPLPATPFLIGRARHCHLRPHSSLVSRVHCAIAPWMGRVLIRDLKSGNGTFLNRRRITSQAAAQDGDILEVGDLSFAFQIQGADKGQNTPAAPLSEKELRWLLDTSDDSAVLDPGEATVARAFDLSDEPIDGLSPPAATETTDTSISPEAASGTPKGSRTLSAGDYLQEYLRTRKKPGSKK